MKLVRNLIFLVSLLWLPPTIAAAISVDGDLNEWGIVVFQDWQSSAGNYLIHDNIYDSDAVVWADDYRYDIEWAGIQKDNQGVSIALVLSNEDVWEDLALTTTGEGNYTWGVDLTGVNHIGDGSVQQRGVYQVTQWRTDIHNCNYPNDPFGINAGTLLGTASFAFRSLGAIEQNDNGWGSTFILEGFVPWAVLGISEPVEVGFHFAEVSCLRDAVYVSITDIPEPATVLLLGSALAALAARRRRRSV